MKTNDLERLTKLAYEQACRIMLGTKQELLTTFVLLKNDNFSGGDCIDVIATPWKNDTEKQEAITAIGVSILRSKEPVYAYSMLTECWFSSYKGGKKQRAARPEFDPQRREGVVCLASDGKKHQFSSWIIERDTQGRCASLTEKTEPGQWSSWMSDALDKAMRLAKFKHEVFYNRGNN
jgi:hypothetical protein